MKIISLKRSIPLSPKPLLHEIYNKFRKNKHSQLTSFNKNINNFNTEQHYVKKIKSSDYTSKVPDIAYVNINQKIFFFVYTAFIYEREFVKEKYIYNMYRYRSSSLSQKNNFYSHPSETNLSKNTPLSYPSQHYTPTLSWSPLGLFLLFITS
jgi:hypothetical protein